MRKDEEKLDAVASPEEVYRRHYSFLVNLAIRKFGIPAVDAETLVHDVFFNFLVSPTPITRVKSYLVIGVCRASKDYLHRERHNVPDAHPEARIDPASLEFSTACVRRMTGHEILLQLRERCREILRLYYVEGYTAKEVAERQGTTRRYVEKLIGKCLHRAHVVYRQMGGTA